MDFLDKIGQLRPVIFEWNDEALEKLELPTGEPQVGLIAQEVEKIFPELVNTRKDGYKEIRYGWLPIYLLKAIQEQDKIIKVLKDELSKHR